MPVARRGPGYRDSSDGLNWSQPSVVVGGELFGASMVGGVTFADRAIVAYTDHDHDGNTFGSSRYRMP